MFRFLLFFAHASCSDMNKRIRIFHYFFLATQECHLQHHAIGTFNSHLLAAALSTSSLPFKHRLKVAPTSCRTFSFGFRSLVSSPSPILLCSPNLLLPNLPQCEFHFIYLHQKNNTREPTIGPVCLTLAIFSFPALLFIHSNFSFIF